MNWKSLKRLEKQMAEVGECDQVSQKKVEEGEIIVGVLPDKLRRMGCILAALRKRCEEKVGEHDVAMAAGDAAHLQFHLEVLDLIEERVDLHNYFWDAVRDELKLPESENHGIRGNEVVKVPEKIEDPSVTTTVTTTTTTTTTTGPPRKGFWARFFEPW